MIELPSLGERMIATVTKVKVEESPGTRKQAAQRKLRTP